VAVSLDPHHAQEAQLEAPLWELGLPDHGALEVEELMRGQRFRWHGKLQHWRFVPGELPFAIWRVAPVGAAHGRDSRGHGPLPHG
jgi:starch synthase (maltosyl-transferring)